MTVSLIAQALTTVKDARFSLGLYTLTATVASESLGADTGSVTFTFDHTDLAEHYLGTFYEGTTADSTISTALITVDYDAGIITFTASVTAGVTISGYSYYAWDYSQDKSIERMINAASSAISRYTGRKFVADTYDEFHKGSGRQKLVLNQYPVNAITSVKVDSAALTAGTDYVTSDSTYLDKGIVFKNDGWTWCGYLVGLVGEPTAPIDNIEVIYSAGYTLANLPSDLIDVCLSMVASSYNEAQNGSTGLKQLTQGKLTYVWKDAELMTQYAGALDSYKKWVF
jgi:hypothetical protein